MTRLWIQQQWVKFLILTALVVVPVVSIYWPMFGHEPVLDDPRQIEFIWGMDSIWDCFIPDSANWYRPFKNVVFYLALGEGANVQALKQVCLALFVLNIYIIYLLLDKLFKSGLWSLLGTAVFAFHPTMVSSVQFLSACNNLICLSFIMLMLWLGLIYGERTADKPKNEWPRAIFSLCLLCLMLALIAYEAAITAFGMLILLLLVRHGWSFCISRHGLRLWGGSVLIIVAYLFIRTDTASMQFISPSLPREVTSMDLILRAPYYAYTHFMLWVEPWGRGGVFLDDDPRDRLMSGLIGWGILAGLTLVLLRLLFTQYRLVAAGVLIYLGGMVPLCNFLALGNGPICNYYLLIPGLGLVIAVIELLRILWNMRAAWVRGLIGVVLMGVLVGGLWETRVRVFAWENEASLIDFSVQNYPDNYHALTLQAIRWIKNGQHDAGTEQLKQAQQLAPWTLKPYTYAAYSYRVQGQNDKAIEVLLQHTEANGYLSWVIGERMAEVYLIERNMEQLDPLLTQLLSMEPHPAEECRFYVRVVIPYFLLMNRIAEAKSLVEALDNSCSGDLDQLEMLRQHEAFLRQRDTAK
ncbi:tetratricopeptide repeat protein [Cerasicoccus fimbriatus]|uniref:tetratricopeptide repeat protein n=1 Tax=Cerasicoccus fimbriatus TaxID=3014554 RepID=UPI0022B5777F|nr:hypothetical protein [Cerasicoccus sp. TK19100]